MTTATTIQTCITRVIKAQDGRGIAQAERLCREALGNYSTSRACAEAARRIGEWLRGKA